jgi:mRNA interferase MazF
VAVTRAARARGDVHLVRLDPTLGSEMQKTRPCLVVSPDELNEHLRTVIVAPMTTAGRAYPWRVPCRFQRRAGFVALDQLRTVDAEPPRSSSRTAAATKHHNRSSATPGNVRRVRRSNFRIHPTAIGRG